jgi:hypothetical protein
MLGHDASLVFPDPIQTAKSLQARKPWAEFIITSDAPLLYPSYQVKQSSGIEDSSENIIIVPEIAPDLLDGFVKIQKAVWWLSTLSSPFSRVLSSKSINHLCQSATAIKMLIERGYENVFPLSDYVVVSPQSQRKVRQVAYNPKKGLELTKQIISSAPDLVFIPLDSMSEEQVADTLGKSMVYIDFGEHPGKDRIPREAAISNCCVIVAKIGTASMFRDVPISHQYKVDIPPFEPARIASLIRTVLDRYDELLPDFEMYRRVISMEREIFALEVQAVFGPANHRDALINNKRVY